jgi:hypothetical protein
MDTIMVDIEDKKWIDEYNGDGEISGNGNLRMESS